ncbi:MAG: hypothetical protein Q8Q23_02860 [bacterium]|nr:hypothetical protein [bacterium]
MNTEDLKQIEQIVRSVVQQEVDKRIEVSETLITSSINQSFQGVQDQMNGLQNQMNGLQDQMNDIREELKKKANESTVLRWGDEQLVPMKNDIDKLKYINRKEWKSLPDSGTMH